MKIHNRIMPFTGTVLKYSLLTLLFALTATYSNADIETIIRVIKEPGANNEALARTLAGQQAAGNGDELGYHSTTEGELQTFSGTYTPPELSDDLKGKYIYKLAIFSDDGCDVFVDENLVHDRYEEDQALPKLGQSFHPLNITLTPGKSVVLKVDYSNTHYKPRPNKPDIDGCTLFVYLEPVKIVDPLTLSEPGSITLPFSNNTSEDDIKTLLTGLLGPAAKIDPDALETLVDKTIRAKIKEIQKNPPDGYLINEEEIIAAVSKAFEATMDQLNKSIENYNKAVVDGIASTAKTIKTKLDEKSPSAKIASNYTYIEGAKNPGNPGWTNPPTIEGSPLLVEIAGGIGLNFSVSLDPAILGNKIGGISFEVIGKAELLAAFEVTGSSPNISPLNQSTSNASVIPEIIYTFKASGEAGAVISKHLSLTISDKWKFNKLTGQIIADQHK